MYDRDVATRPLPSRAGRLTFPAMCTLSKRAFPALAALVLAPPAAAQAPGYDQIDTRKILAEYHAEVISQINRVAERWGTSWAQDDVEGVLDQYWENAVLIVPGETPHRGAEAIDGYLRRVLPLQGGMEAFMLDFDASGGMAVVYGNYLVQESGQQRSGPVVTVYLQRGRTWKIRSQVFTGN